MGTGVRPKTRTPGWLARLLPCYSSVGSDWFTSLVPADLLNCSGPHRYGPFRALLTGPEPNLPALFPGREARSLTFLPGSPHPGRPEAKHRNPGPSGKFAPTRQPHANRPTPLAVGQSAELLVR